MGRTTALVAISVILLGAVWLARGWSADQSLGGGSALDAAALPEGAPLVEVVVPQELSPEAAVGRGVFDATCAVCHGMNAAGSNGAGPPLVHRVYEPSHHADVAFVMAARSGVRAHHWQFGNMPAIDQPLTDAEINSVVRYVRELQDANGID